MKRVKGKLYLLIIFVLIFALSACSPSNDFEMYQGKSLRIALVGVSPNVKEEQVSFTKLSLDEMTSDELKSYDAVFIMKENLSKAAESQYADTYLNSTIPIFFISAKSHVPFTEKDTEYNETWEWSPGNNYAVGVHSSQDALLTWGFGLYNDKNTDENIGDVYSRIFKAIEVRRSKAR